MIKIDHLCEVGCCGIIQLTKILEARGPEEEYDHD